MKIDWSPKYELGINVIDNQHKRIVDYINQIHDTENDSSSNETLDNVLQNLLDYTYSHFAFEEALMEEANYSDLTGHQLTHSTFTKQIEIIKKRFDHGETVAVELTNMLQKWLLNHIQVDDLNYTATVKENILKKNADQHHTWSQRAYRRFFTNQRF